MCESDARRLVRTILLALVAALPACGKKEPRREEPNQAEPSLNLERMVGGAQNYFETNFDFPTTSSDWTPPSTACDGAQRRAHRAAEWKRTPAWDALNFDDPSFGSGFFYFSYRYTTNGGRKFVVEARADLDCDGKYSLFRRTARADEGQFRDTDLEITDPLE